MSEVLLFDFFGTLVGYEQDWTALGYPRSHALVAGMGFHGDQDAFVAAWDAASRVLEAQSAITLHEPSMADYAEAFAQYAHVELADRERGELAATFNTEWSEHIYPISGAADLLVALGSSYRLGVVSNTNDPAMVPRFVAEHFADAEFEHLVLSVDHGFRKPHPSIYAAACARFAIDPSDAVFVGDSFDADYEGPMAAGMRALLIDPTSRHPLPESDRLDSILHLADRV